MPESYSVDDILRLVDGLKEKGVSSFRGCGLELDLGNAPKKKDPIASKRKPRKNAVDLALEMNERDE